MPGINAWNKCLGYGNINAWDKCLGYGFLNNSHFKNRYYSVLQKKTTCVVNRNPGGVMRTLFRIKINLMFLKNIFKNVPSGYHGARSFNYTVHTTNRNIALKYMCLGAICHLENAHCCIIFAAEFVFRLFDSFFLYCVQSGCLSNPENYQAEISVLSSLNPFHPSSEKQFTQGANIEASASLWAETSI